MTEQQLMEYLQGIDRRQLETIACNAIIDIRELRTVVERFADINSNVARAKRALDQTTRSTLGMKEA